MYGYSTSVYIYGPKIYLIPIILGFSFGGSLAQLCAVQLYSLSQSICPELLEKNLLCVTFGQPIMSELVPEPVTGNLDRSRFHAIYIADDAIPRVLRCLDPAFDESAVAASEISENIKIANKVNNEYNICPILNYYLSLLTIALSKWFEYICHGTINNATRVCEWVCQDISGPCSV